MRRSEQAIENNRKYTRAYDAKRQAQRRAENAEKRAKFGETRGRKKGALAYAWIVGETTAIDTAESFHQLATSIIIQAAQDWRKQRHKPKSAKRDLIDFFMSYDFEIYCDLARVNPDVVLEGLEIETEYIAGRPPARINL